VSNSSIRSGSVFVAMVSLAISAGWKWVVPILAG